MYLLITFSAIFRLVDHSAHARLNPGPVSMNRPRLSRGTGGRSPGCHVRMRLGFGLERLGFGLGLALGFPLDLTRFFKLGTL